MVSADEPGPSTSDQASLTVSCLFEVDANSLFSIFFENAEDAVNSCSFFLFDDDSGACNSFFEMMRPTPTQSRVSVDDDESGAAKPPSFFFFIEESSIMMKLAQHTYSPSLSMMNLAVANSFAFFESGEDHANSMSLSIHSSRMMMINEIDFPILFEAD